MRIREKLQHQEVERMNRKIHQQKTLSNLITTQTIEKEQENKKLHLMRNGIQRKKNHNMRRSCIKKKNIQTMKRSLIQKKSMKKNNTQKMNI